MTLMVYGIKNCDSMKKTFAWLAANEIPYTFVDFKTTPPTEAQVEQWLACLGERLVNTRGPSYRQLPDAVKANFTGAARIAAIIAKPTLIKRPLLVKGAAMTVGFAPENWGSIPTLLTKD
ncbi:MAG: Spx/MgsR family RNA polymerase-binding regulatory protein [Bacteroidetes bacterium]|nr:Spx/MgsR family RNA polymerase-binding regulatory protein [Bacteroidota bacterium]